MIRRSSILVVALVLSACGENTATELRMFKDPVNGAETIMRVTRVGNVEIVVPESAPAALVQVVIDGRNVLGITTTGKRRLVMLLDGKNSVPVTITTSVPDGKLEKIEYWGSQWTVWDDNADGQADIRVRKGSKIVEIWLDGQWLERRTVDNGKERQYFVGNREVSFSETGWKYDGP